MLALSSGSIKARFHPKGARLVSCVVDGTETVLGNRVVDGTLQGDQYAGAICGRHAGRITHASFLLDGQRVHLQPNMGPHQLHGGAVGFDALTWDYIHDGNRLTFYLESADGDQGYPGHLSVRAVYTLSGPVLSLQISARTSAPTVCNLTNHAYWNLAGGGSVLAHDLRIPAQHYFPLSDLLLPIGRADAVEGTRWDFQRARTISQHYDNAFALAGERGKLKHAMMMRDPVSGRTLDVYSTENVLQIYTAMHWNGDGTALGPDGPLQEGGALAIEPQNVADAPNHPNFPSSILRPGETYRNHIEWRFS